MLQRYKLRLGDGTVLLVDHDGLGTWLVDGKASVQAGKSRNWIPLRKFLASERASVARRARSEAAAWASLPADSPGARRADGLPLVPPPPREETPAPDAPAPRADGLPLVAPPPPGEEVPPPDHTPPPREDGLPLVAPPPPRDAAPPDVAPPSGENELSLVLPGPLEDEDPSPSLLSAPTGVDDSSLAAPASSSEELVAGSMGIGGDTALPAVELFEEEAPASAAPPTSEEDVVRVIVGDPRVVQFATEEAVRADSEPPGDTPPAEGYLAVSAEALSFIEKPLRLPEPPLMEPAVRGHVGEPLEVQALAEEPVPSEAGSGPVADLPVIPLKPLEEDVPSRPTPLPAGTGGTLGAAGGRDRRRTDDHRGDPADWGPDDAVQASASEPGSGGATGTRNPIGPFDRGGPFSETLGQLGRAVAAHRVVVSLGAFLSRCLDPINRLERGLPLFPAALAGEAERDRRTPERTPVAAPRLPGEIAQVRPLAEEPSLDSERDSRALASNDGLPVIPLEPLEEDGTSLWDPARGRQLLARARGWMDKPATWIARLAERDRPGPPAEPEAHQALEPAPRQALEAPPAITDLPVLHFATTHEPAVVENVYGGDETEAFLPSAWLWAKRLALAAAALAAATLAALTFETWSPKAAEIGETTLSEIDGRVRSHHLAGQRQEAVSEVTSALPQLDRSTIGRVMAASPTGLLDAAGVFETACDATDRGVSALTAGDARELEALQQGLLEALLPAERERLREFDLARARGAVFPVDGRQALAAYARGARQLPPASLERLRLLLGRAITAGLAGPSQATTEDAALR